MSLSKALLSTGKDDWRTPPSLFARLNAEFRFTLDVAADTFNTKCARFYEAYDDGLKLPWAGTCWCNPPYSRGLQAKFIAKASAERINGVTTVMLIPARTDTKAFHAYIWNAKEHRPYKGVEVRFLPGRIKFVGAKHGAPFPSMVVIFRGATGSDGGSSASPQ